MIVCIGTSSDFEEGKGKCVRVEHYNCAVFRVNGELGCIRNECVHAGGPLCEGWIRNGKVVCPWHKWEYDFKTGKGFSNECQGGFRIWEECGSVYVDAGTPLTKRVEYPAL